MLCNCPLGESLTSIPVYNCPETFGQIQKVIITRMTNGAGVKNGFAEATASIKKKASWTPLMVATDGTKCVVTPYLNAPTTEAGAMRTYGGGNDTVGGIELNIGTEPTKFSATLLRERSQTIKAIKALECETNLGVYLIDENGKIGAIADDATTPTFYSPIPIQSFFVGDRNLGGFDAPDSNAISWSFKPNWSMNLVSVVVDDFEPLTDLQTLLN